MPPSGSLHACQGEGVDEASTRNVLLVGDNLEILRLLQKSYARRVKLVYIDPPYNTGEDFVYADRFGTDAPTYLRHTRQADVRGRLTSNPKRGGRFHSNWLSFLYPRLVLGRNLLREDGYFVVSIDDAEQANLRLLMDAVFGEENFLATLVWDRNRKNDARFFSVGHEYMHVYAKDKERLAELEVVLRAPKEGVEEARALFQALRVDHADDWAKVGAGFRAFYAALPADDPRKPLGRFTLADADGPYEKGNLNWPGGGGPTYAVLHPVTGRPCKVPKSGWRYPTAARFWEVHRQGRIVFGPDETTTPRAKVSLFQSAVQVLGSVHYSYAQVAAQRFDALFGGRRVFDNPKHFEDMARIVAYLSGPDDLVLDFFAGSGSTAHGVWLANHKHGGQRTFVAAQLDAPVNEAVEAGRNAAALGMRTLDAITKERLRRAATQLRAEGAVGDLGFRVLREDASHLRRGGPYEGDDPAELAARLREQHGLAPDWRADDVILELMLLEGYPLDARPTRSPEFADNVVTCVTHASLPARLLVCLDEHLAESTIAALAACPDDLFACREDALDDSAKLRLAAVVARLRTL